jgi:hypothetical protein
MALQVGFEDDSRLPWRQRANGGVQQILFD